MLSLVEVSPFIKLKIHLALAKTQNYLKEKYDRKTKHTIKNQ